MPIQFDFMTAFKAVYTTMSNCSPFRLNPCVLNLHSLHETKSENDYLNLRPCSFTELRTLSIIEYSTYSLVDWRHTDYFLTITRFDTVVKILV